MSGWGILLPSVVKAKSVSEVLIEAAVRNIRFDGIKGKVCSLINMFEQALCEVVHLFYLIVLSRWML